jgi:cell division septation protein DedD
MTNAARTDRRPPTSISITMRAGARRAVWALSLSALSLVTGGAMRAQGTDTAAARRDTGATVARDSTGTRPPLPSSNAAVPDSAQHHAAAGLAATQDAPAEAKSPADTTLQRVRALVAQGQTTAARALVDSLVVSTPPTSIAYASVLYARATLATDADSAERDYRRVTVEYPGSLRAADALLRLAQLELARGDRVQAAAHLDRLTREQLPDQTGAGAARTDLQIGLAYVDLQDLAHACAAFGAARAAAPGTDVELRNRIDYNAQRCAALAQATGPSTDTVHSGGVATGSAGRHGVDSTSRRRAHAPAPASRQAPTSSPTEGSKPTSPSTSPKPAVPTDAGRRLRTSTYTVQVAAFNTRAEASDLADKLGHGGYVARIYGTSAPFRVRIGQFATEGQADSVSQSLKRKGIIGFVTPSETPKI